MNTNSTQSKKPPAKQKERVVMGLQAMDFIQHGTEASLDIVTPLGQRLHFKANFIGFDDQQNIFFTMPKLSKGDYEEFFMEGFNVDIEGISEQGEGALIKFRTRIEHVIYRPVQLLVFPVPQQAKLVLLRNEIRYDLRLPSDIQLTNRKLRVILIDVSSGGCGFSYDAISPEFDVDQRIVLEVVNSANGDTYALSGAIKNGRKKRGKQTYGMVFDDPGKANCRRLLSVLIYDGTKYVFKNPKKEV
ncbi:PilZ domain-containing protein [Enterovibrio nigricans]|uniref:C-di-GMP-binding flagellar brake protein YcgR, contains PilZNR and PilZ domains n=1 Tax=Enterovibrio nigricans DSM 22720 TaxID=1121868 RepID=A0A1T4USU8_9GAMM|nr:flagellar brake protein [Enterovibrio nigricans]PKF50796.1 flagellar brake protein [Enterovibrio nigricans]SKA55734.1 c-di-GMP-binding flagellar brake protein YcgR, contains PilZNR and PilZ domains [Enterovibrio nigricans DSM 22720]